MEERKSEKNDCALSHRQTSGAPFSLSRSRTKRKIAAVLRVWEVRELELVWCGISFFRFSLGVHGLRQTGFPFLFFNIIPVQCAHVFHDISFHFYILWFIWFLEKKKRVPKKTNISHDSTRRWWNRKRNDDISGPGGPDAPGWTDPLHSHCR